VHTPSEQCTAEVIANKLIALELTPSHTLMNWSTGAETSPNARMLSLVPTPCYWQKY